MGLGDRRRRPRNRRRPQILAARRRQNPDTIGRRLPYEENRKALGAVGAEDEDAFDVAGAAGAGD
jgi:hypothetical protein